MSPLSYTNTEFIGEHEITIYKKILIKIAYAKDRKVRNGLMESRYSKHKSGCQSFFSGMKLHPSLTQHSYGSFAFGEKKDLSHSEFVRRLNNIALIQGGVLRGSKASSCLHLLKIIGIDDDIFKKLKRLLVVQYIALENTDGGEAGRMSMHGNRSINDICAVR